MNYHATPALPIETFNTVNKFLISWLPSSEPADRLAHWPQEYWLAAEWLTYWRNALPWFAARLRDSHAAPPEDIWRRLTEIEKGSRERTHLMLDAAVELVDTLQTAGIETILLKGVVLSPLYYPDPLLRPLADIDILVKTGDMAATLAQMNQLGYVHYSRSSKDETMIRGDRKTNVWAADNVQPVDVHISLLGDVGGLKYDNTQEMWRNREKREFWNGVQAWVPRPASLLNHVASHATRDWLMQTGKLSEISDLQHLTKKLSTTDWQAFANSISADSARFLYPSLQLAMRYTDAPVPPEILRKLRDLSPTGVRDWVDQADMSDAFEIYFDERKLVRPRIARIMAKSPVERTKMLLQSSLPPKDEVIKKYPGFKNSPVWPIAYIPLTLRRAGLLVSKRLGRKT